MPPISTKWTTIFHLKALNTKKKTMTYGIGNPGLGLGQAQKYGRIKLVNGISTLPLCRFFYQHDFQPSTSVASSTNMTFNPPPL
jgi:hypothetical protein